MALDLLRKRAEKISNSNGPGGQAADEMNGLSHDFRLLLGERFS